MSNSQMKLFPKNWKKNKKFKSKINKMSTNKKFNSIKNKMLEKNSCTLLSDSDHSTNNQEV